MKYISNHWIKILLITSLFTLTSALVAEYFFNLIPCEMCLKQRNPYYFIIILIIIFTLFKNLKYIIFLLLTKIAVIYGLFYSVWHVGVEQKLLDGPEKCSGILLDTGSLEEMKAQIKNQEVINCSEIIWSIGGLSAATLNSILLLLILVINTILIIRHYDEYKKK
tara:strand:+ start:332 stop:826 length:495 start_codon:yes stop_codon:yes gene_type:complete